MTNLSPHRKATTVSTAAFKHRRPISRNQALVIGGLAVIVGVWFVVRIFASSAMGVVEPGRGQAVGANVLSMTGASGGHTHAHATSVSAGGPRGV